MSRGADESSRKLDKMLAAAQFNGNPLNALGSGSAFSDELSMEVPDLGGPEIVGSPTSPKESQVAHDPKVDHGFEKNAPPPTGADGQPIEIKATRAIDDLAISLAKKIEIDYVEKREFAYTITPAGAVHVRVGQNSESMCVRGGLLCLHTHPEQKDVRDQSHRLGFGGLDWQPVHAGMPSYILNLDRQVFVLEYDLKTGYTPRFVDNVPYEGK